MGDREPADRDAGPLRWGKAQRQMLQKYLDEGRIDLARIDSAAYMRELAAMEEVWRILQLRGKQRNFNQNVRRACREWQVDNAMRGARRAAADGDDDDDDDDAYEDDPHR